MVDQYTIWNPGWYHMSGGIRAIHRLKVELLDRGVNTAFHNERRHVNELVIYPEIIVGNPINAPRHIKWLLNKAHFPDEECWAWESGMGDFPLLTVNMIELNIWKPIQKTGGVAYWIGKGIPDYSKIPNGAIEISRNNFFDRVELARFMAGLDYFISFDPFSAINLEATLVNTPVLIINNDNNWSRDIIENQGWLKYGVAWNEGELDLARSTVYNSRQHYENLCDVFAKRIDNFIEVTMR